MRLDFRRFPLTDIIKPGYIFSALPLVRYVSQDRVGGGTWGGGQGHRASPADFAILTLDLWALHRKNGAKSRRCPPLNKSLPSLLLDRSDHRSLTVIIKIPVFRLFSDPMRLPIIRLNYIFHQRSKGSIYRSSNLWIHSISNDSTNPSLGPSTCLITIPYIFS